MTRQTFRQSEKGLTMYRLVIQCTIMSNDISVGIKERKIACSWRLSKEIVEQIEKLAEETGHGKTYIVETYLGTALGVREFPAQLPEPKFANAA